MTFVDCSFGIMLSKCYLKRLWLIFDSVWVMSGLFFVSFYFYGCIVVEGDAGVKVFVFGCRSDGELG